MASPASRTVPSSPNPAAHDPPRSRDRNNLKTGDQDSAFRGINRGKVTRGSGVKGGRGAPTNPVLKSVSHPDTPKSAPSSSPTVPPVPPKPPVPTSAAATPKASSEKAVGASTERPKAASRKQARAAPAVVVAPSSPSQTSQTAPPTPSRSAHRRRRLPLGKGPTIPAKPLSLPNTIKAQSSRVGATLAPQAILHKDVPSHLAAAHEAEIRHDIDILVERVRAVAMAENRPMTPGSHIDWAGDEDDSLPDLDDWGVTTTHTSATHHENQSKEISPILADTLKPLPEPNSHVLQGHETESCDVEPGKEQESFIEPSFLSSPTTGTTTVPPTTEKAPEQCTTVPMTAEESSSSTPTEEKPPLHPSLPPKPTATVESLRARSRSISKLSNPPPPRPRVFAEEEALTEGLSGSIHAPSADEHLASETVSRASSNERGLAASIHAPASGLPESHSAPSLLSTHPPPPSSRAHSRSQTESHVGTHQPHTATSHRRGRSGASSPLGKHISAHSRNYSTPAGGMSSRLPHASRPVITGEAISRLARTIGGLESNPRSRTIPVTRDPTIS